MKQRNLMFLMLLLGALAVFCAGMALGLRAVIEGGKEMVDGAGIGESGIERVIDGYTSVFIVDSDSGVILVDTGLDPQATAIARALERRGGGLDDVRAILFTHGHGDHIGGAAAMPEVPLYALEAEIGLIEGERAAGNMIGCVRGAQPTGLEVEHALADGQVIEVDGVEIEVFAVPGHTLGHVAYLIRGALILGDAGAAMEDDVLAGPPPVFSADRDQALDSLEALARRLRPRADEIRWLIPSHQGAIEGVEPLLAWAP